MSTPRLIGPIAAAIVIGVGGIAVYRWTKPSVAPSGASRAGMHGADKPAPSSNVKPPADNARREETTASVARPAATPADILARLKALKVSPKQPQSVRQLIFELENLKAAGPAALPAIRALLASGEDVDYDAAAKGNIRDAKVPTEFTVPPSLRLGLLEVVKNIGGAEAEALLVQELKTTGRGVEVAYLAGVLQELAPGRYRDASVRAVQDLLAMPLSTTATNALDRSDREYLYQVLTAANDRSYAAQAQAQLLLPDGRIDRGALNYLQKALGEGSLAVAAQAWDDPRVAPNQKEPLARIALTYVGVDPKAEQLYQTAINEMSLSNNARQNLIEDLNEAGFPNPKKLTASDLPLIQRRLALIEQLAPQARDPVNIAAFAEAKKDLLKMQAGLLQPAPRQPKK